MAKILKPCSQPGVCFYADDLSEILHIIMISSSTDIKYMQSNEYKVRWEQLMVVQEK